MAVLITILIILAILLCGLRAFGVNPVRPHLGWLGVTAALIAWLLGNLHL